MTYRYFMPRGPNGKSACEGCVHLAPAGDECISCTSLVSTYNKDKNKASPNLRIWWLTRIKHEKYPETEAMRRGKETHKEYMKKLHVGTVSKALKDLQEVGKTVRWSSKICSRYMGIRGEPDFVESTRLSDTRLRHVIVELKSFWPRHRKIFIQGASYGLILSYRQMLTDGLPFYDLLKIENLRVDIDFEFRFYTSGEPIKFQLTRDWKFITQGEDGFRPDGTPYGAEFIYGIKAIRQKFSGLRSVKFISDIPACGYCPPLHDLRSSLRDGAMLPEQLCAFWKFCSSDLLATFGQKQTKLGQFGIKALPKTYTEAEVTTLKENYAEMTDEELSQILGRSKESIAAKRRNLKLLKRETDSMRPEVIIAERD